MRSIKVYSIIGLLVCLPLFVFSQNIKQDLTGINKAYLGLKSVKMKMAYSLFKSYDSKQAEEVAQGELRSSGNNKYYKLLDMESIKNDRYYLTVDHHSKNIIMGEYQESASAWEESDYIGKVDKYLALYEKFNYSEKENIGSYDMVLKRGEYSRVIISFNKSTHFITKLVFYYREKVDISTENTGELSLPRVEIEYKEIQTGVSFAKDEFSVNKYLIKSGKKYVCKPEYKEYQLNVQLLSNKD